MTYSLFLVVFLLLVLHLIGIDVNIVYVFLYSSILLLYFLFFLRSLKLTILYDESDISVELKNFFFTENFKLGHEHIERYSMEKPGILHFLYFGLVRDRMGRRFWLPSSYIVKYYSADGKRQLWHSTEMNAELIVFFERLGTSGK